MSNVFLSVRGRVLINVEALNMTESVGNYVKHRRVPIILPETGYTTFFVPAISGESIAHGYQHLLAQTALKEKLPVCNICARGIFLKSTNRPVFVSQFRERLKELLNSKGSIENASDFERFVIENCVVEDVGGFLYAPGQREAFEVDTDKELINQLNVTEENVKRTSNFFTGYMIPVREALQSVVIEPQLHTRYALGTPFIEREQRGQMIYNVELSSAVYTFSFDLDTRFIGKTTYHYSSVGKSAMKDTVKRVEVSLDSFEKFAREMLFGAKKTRFLPIIDWESMILAVSNDVWTVPNSFTVKYLTNSLEKAEKFRPEKLKLFVYVNREIISEISKGKAGIEVITKDLLKKVKEEITKKRKEMEEVFSDQKEIIESKFSELTQDVLKDLIEREVHRLVEEKVKREIGNEKLLNELKGFLDKADEKSNVEIVKVFDTLEEAIFEAVKYAKESLVGSS